MKLSKIPLQRNVPCYRKWGDVGIYRNYLCLSMLTLQVTPKRQAGYEFRTHRWKSSKEFRDSFLFVFASFFIYNSVKTYAVNKKIEERYINLTVGVNWKTYLNS